MRRERGVRGSGKGVDSKREAAKDASDQWEKTQPKKAEDIHQSSRVRRLAVHKP